jgi:Leucine-rich repeat (LRR) protein
MVSYIFKINQFLNRSEEAVELATVIKSLGQIKEVSSEEFIIHFFESLNMQNKAIIKIDLSLARFHNLKVLNLSFNKIQKLEYIPPNLEELYVNGNAINEIGINQNKPLVNLIHLGISMNQIRQPALTQIVKVFPNLFCLDISYNDLCDMNLTLVWLMQLSKLRMLSLEGNPLVLT